MEKPFFENPFPLLSDPSLPGENCTHGSVRLVNNGVTGSEGRLEICINNMWGSVCRDIFDFRDANVVCKQYGNQIGSRMTGISC